MDGWIAWLIHAAGMIVAGITGIALLAFFIDPLLVLLGAAAFGLVHWGAGPRRPHPHVTWPQRKTTLGPLPPVK